MKTEELAEILLKNPNLEIKIFNTDWGFYENININSISISEKELLIDLGINE